MEGRFLPHRLLSSFISSWRRFPLGQLMTLILLTASQIFIFVSVTFFFQIHTLVQSSQSKEVVVFLSANSDFDLFFLKNLSGLQEYEYLPAEESKKSFYENIGIAQAEHFSLLDEFTEIFTPRVRLFFEPNSWTDDTKKNLIDHPAVEEVLTGSIFSAARLRTFTAIRFLGIVLTIMIILGALVILGHSLYQSLNGRRTQIEVSKLLGATSHWISRPFLVEGFIMGVFSAIIAVLFVVFLRWSLLDMLEASIFLKNLAAPISYWVWTRLVIGLMGVGAFLGMFAAWLAFCKINRDLEYQRVHENLQI